MSKPAHYTGSYHVRSRAVRDAANADPATRCWRCGRTLDEHPPHKNGKRGHWQAGHVNQGEQDGLLLPEVSVCNVQHGAKLGYQRMRARRVLRTIHRTSRRW